MFMYEAWVLCCSDVIVMGVLLADDVECGFLIGPIPRNVTLLDPLLMIGHVTADNTPDLCRVKVYMYKTN